MGAGKNWDNAKSKTANNINRNDKRTCNEATCPNCREIHYVDRSIQAKWVYCKNCRGSFDNEVEEIRLDY